MSYLHNEICRYESTRTFPDQVVYLRFGWNVKNFARNLLIVAGSTQRGVNWQRTQRLPFVGGEGGEGGWSTVNSGRICREVEICRWEGGEGRGRGGQLTINWGRNPWRLWKDYLWQCWSWGSIDNQLGKDPQRLLQTLELTVDWPPRSTLSEVILPKSLQILPKLIVIDPTGSTLSEVILPKSLWILPKLIVDRP